MSRELVIERRFRGPERSANGGYAAGVIAAAVEPAPAVEVTLLAPPPLETPMTIDLSEGGAELRAGELLTARARPGADPAPRLPTGIPLEQAAEASSRSFLRDGTPYPECFVCGPDREPGDGLGVVCGIVDGTNLVAAPWDTSAEDGASVPDELVWAALDCPGGIAAITVEDFGVSMLGRITAMIPAPLPAGETYVAAGWPISRDGRKLQAGSMISTADGEPVAWSQAVWIELREQPPG